MRTRRTPIAYYFVALALGMAGGLVVSEVSMSTRADLMGVHWLVSLLLLALGVLVLIMCVQVHRYAKGERKELDSRFAVNALIMSKSLGIACAALLGWYGAQALMSMGHASAPYYASVMVECLVAAAVCLVDVVIGAVGEWLCQLPPDEGPENPEKRGPKTGRMPDAVQKNRTD
ncbi:DUF3180 domain-containing protein [Bifidobacterium indicum]|uniref:DUF3180 domain-containing protein n=1 Tax=Bifidobacterium indicum TaxID=1691 RepID=UPI002613C90A|nr:DUF3180 domain-containing protein [uncultured Bifidobacterium sp.]